jgi:hypothetical protein
VYEVFWDDDVYSDAASIWVDASDRLAVLDAIHKIDQFLMRNPAAAGTELSEGLFWVDQAPIRALFSVDESAKRVRVHRIRRL